MNKKNQFLTTCVCLLAVLCILSIAEARQTSHQQKAKQILDTTGFKGGLVVHIGCGDGRLTATLRANDSYLIHGLDSDEKIVEKARKHIQSLKLYGKVSIDQLKGNYLPYTDNLVNLVVSENLDNIPMDEVMRILAPNGIAYIKMNDTWMKIVKPWPKEIDEWTHYLHDATNNAVANDSVVGPPHHMQWVGGPKWARSHDHLASVSVVVSSGGRIFYIVDEGPIASIALPAEWFLVARDAFNGVVLWKRQVGPWEGQLRDFRSGPAELARRLVAVKGHLYVTLGYGKPVNALDAATGETVRTYDGTEGAIEILYHDGVLFVVVGNRDAEEAAEAAKRRGAVLPPCDKRILAIKADTGNLLWEKSDSDTAEMMPTTLCVGGGRVFFHATSEVICLGAMSGSELWRAARPISLTRWMWSTPTLVVHDDVVISADRVASASANVTENNTKPVKVQWTMGWNSGATPAGEMIAFSAKTGQTLWTNECREGFNSPVDVFVIDGLVWSGNLVTWRNPGITVARDLLTGQIKKQRPKDDAFFNVGMNHHRCYRNKATNQYILLGRAGVEFIELSSGRGIANHWIRGTCQYGIMPCNGLLYLPPHSCACYITSKLNGFNVLAPRRESKPSEQKDDCQLECGPTYGYIDVSGTAGQNDWPTYRRDPARSGFTESTVPAALKSIWQVRLGGKLTSPTVANGKVFVALVDTHTVYALDANNGSVVWDYTTGGRVDSPPTIYKGLAVFGSADGWVYCLRASDGQLVWRFRAAPQDLRVVAYGQLESAWPVHGSVLLHDDVVYFAAGRSSFLDGGIYLYRLNPKTGKELLQKRIDSRNPSTSEQIKGMVGGKELRWNAALPDVLSSDGVSVYMRHMRLNPNDLMQEEPPIAHLYSAAGFLDDSWWHRTYWFIGTRMVSGWAGWPMSGNMLPAGRLLVCNESCVYGFGRSSYVREGSHVGLDKTYYRLFAADRKLKEAEKPAPKPEDEKSKQSKELAYPESRVNYHWSKRVPLVVRAMVLADKTLFLAGPPDSGNELDALAGLDGSKGAVLYAVSSEDGKKLGEYKLDSPPVFDGMAAANGRLYLSMKNGRVFCLAEK